MALLCRFEIAKYKSLFRLVDRNRQYLRNWLPWLDTVKSAGDSLTFIEQCLVDENQSQSLNYFIQNGDEIIGVIGIREISDRSGIIGYWIDQSMQNKGITTWAVNELLSSKECHLLIDNVYLRCAKDNVASRKIAEKCGFHFVEVLSNAENLYGIQHDLLVFTLTIKNLGSV